MQTLQYEAPVRGGNLTSAVLTTLPVSSRDPVQLALTLPGVSTNRFGFGVGTFVVNGSRGRSNNFMVDGTENNDVSVAGQLSQILNPDAVAEVSVQTSNFDAEYGRAGGAVVNTITKSGTNDVHGSLSYVLDATIDDAITNTQSLNDEVKKRGHPFPGTEQWYGFTVGGPIVKNRTFFFGAFQDQRQNSQNTTNLTTPTAAGMQTLNSLFPTGVNARLDLYRSVVSKALATSQPFNIALGAGRPDVEFGTAITPYGNKYLDRQFMFKVDHMISSSDQLSMRYMRDRADGPQSGASDFFPGFSTSYQYPVANAVISETHVFTPATTNEARFAFNRAELAYPLDTADSRGLTMPRYSIGGGVSAIGVQTNLPQGRTVNNYALQDTVSHVRGTHSFRFGLTITQQRARQYAPIVERGSYSYAASTGYTGFANFIDDYGGSGGGVQRDFGSPAYYPSYTRQAYFAQDRWRVTKDLTLTLGIRYEYFGLPMNTLKKPAFSGLFNIDPATNTGPYSQPNQVDADKNNWAPIVGIAYSPSGSNGLLGRLFGSKKSVIRTGYQIGYDSFFNNIASNAATATPNVIATSTSSSVSTANPRGLPNLSTLLPTTARAPSPLDSQTLMVKNLVNPYYQRWSFGIQRELPASLILDVSYLGSKGTRLFVNEDMNPVVPQTMRIYPNYAGTYTNTRYDVLQGSRLTRTNGGDSNYHSLQIGVDRRMYQGLIFKAAYTWSKLIDNASEVFGVGNVNSPQNTALPSIFGGLTMDRGVSLFDRTHRAVFSYSYQLPVLREQRGILGQVFGGWSVSGVTTFETGVPLNVYNGLDADGIGGNYDRPNYNPNGKPGVRAVYNTSSSTGYVNPDAANAPIDPSTAMYISLPANASTVRVPTGNLGRNTLRVPGINNFNVNFHKTVRVWKERVRTEFRTEFYNIWNHPQYGVASVSPFSPGGGSMAASVATSASGRFLQPQYMDGGGRVIRYQLRILF